MRDNRNPPTQSNSRQPNLDQNGEDPSLREFEEQRFHGTGGRSRETRGIHVSDPLEPQQVISPEGFQDIGAYVDAVFIQELDMSPQAGILEVEEQAVDGRVEDGEVIIEYGPLMDQGYQGSMSALDPREVRMTQAFDQISPRESVSVELDKVEEENALTATISYPVDDLQQGTYEAVDAIESLDQAYASLGDTTLDGEV